MYKKIAKFYDRLGWSKFPLQLWEQMKKYLKETDFQPTTHLDIACGTGALPIQTYLEGIESEGLDFSKEMLDIAKENAIKMKVDVQFYYMDMKGFKLNKTYDLITCTYDAINHLLDIEEWKQTFRSVQTHLNDNGIFIFDCNTLKALRERWNSIHVNKDSDGNYLIQKAIHDEERGISTASFTVFTKEENGLYDSFEDSFTEAGFLANQIIELLKEVGFQTITITNTNFKEITNPDDEYRNVFICRK